MQVRVLPYRKVCGGIGNRDGIGFHFMSEEHQLLKTGDSKKEGVKQFSKCWQQHTQSEIRQSTRIPFLQKRMLLIQEINLFERFENVPEPSLEAMTQASSRVERTNGFISSFIKSITLK